MMPTQSDNTGNYKPETDSKEKDSRCSTSTNYDENDAAGGAENTSPNDHTVTMSLAGSISLGTMDILYYWEWVGWKFHIIGLNHTPTPNT